MHRRALGLSRTRLAARTGLPSREIARWERGDELPPPDALGVLAEAIGLEEHEIQGYVNAIVDISDPDVEVHLVEDDASPSPNPFAERARLLRTSPGPLDRLLTRVDGLRFRTTRPTSTDRLRALGSSPSAAQPAPSERTGLPRTPRRTPGVIPNLRGRVDDPAVRIYSNGSSDHQYDRSTYQVRSIGTIVALAALAVTMWWAIGALGEGIGEVVDLFRGTSNVPPSQLP